VAAGFSFPAGGPRGARWIGTLVSCAAFGLAHSSNPNVTKVAVANIAGAGLLLALAFLWTGRLGLPLGLHWMWNVAQGPVFGIPVSGMTTASLIVSRETGPDEFTGGAFGLEGGLILLAMLVLGIVLCAAWTRWRRGAVAVDTVLLQP
jgi:membrane protease YdiL (CAAX protease family)